MERFRAVIAALALVGLAAVAEAAVWLPADFGANDPRRGVAFGENVPSGVLGDGTGANPGCIADHPFPAVLQRLRSARPSGTVLVNAGRGGERTEGGASRMPSVLADEHPGFVLIQLVKANGSIPILGAIPPNFRPSGVQFADGARSIIAAVNAMLPGVADQELDDSLVWLAQAYLLRVSGERIMPGDLLRVDLTLTDQLTVAVADIYLGLLLPPGADAILGCPPGEAMAFVADDFARLVTTCRSDAAEMAVPLYRDRLLRQPIPVTTLADFWTVLLTSGYPPGITR